jgi:hypothetical protein
MVSLPPRSATFGITEYEVKIYSRWGELIYKFDQNDEGWDGQNCNPGVYLVLLRAKDSENKLIVLNQTLTLIK